MFRYSKGTIVLVTAFSFSTGAWADTIKSDDVIVTATRIPYVDSDATFASEIHDGKEIEASGSTTLYDFLSQHTSLNVSSNYGNKFTPQIDMRGYGLGTGFQNIVVSLDGQRLNNIDGMPQLLGAIPLADIDRIEIVKGGGSVMYGDGATAGSIQIYTKSHTGISASALIGNHGTHSGTVSAGLVLDRLEFSASAIHDDSDGTGNPDVTGHRDTSLNNTQRAQLKIRATDQLRLTLDGSNTHIDTRYVGWMSLAQFHADPSQNAGNIYTHQVLESKQWRIGGEFDLTQQFKLTASHNREEKVSDYGPFWHPDYDYDTNDLALQYRGDRLDVTTGIQTFDGVRNSSTNRTSKDNTGVFALARYNFNDFAVSAGVRTEKVEYEYAPLASQKLSATHHLSAWDIGANYRVNGQTTLFANYNQAFQAPDIDRFFNFGGTFNAFIAPQKSRTLNIGLSHDLPGNRLKATIFHVDLNNEIYFNPATWVNTNIDSSHKYGLELQDNWRITDYLGASALYTYTRAIIDHENDGGGTFNGKNLPGVPKHGVTLGLNYTPWTNASLNLSHVWRSTAYAANDFANNFSQKQAAYQSTNVAFRYQYKNWEGFAAVENLFEHKNGLWISDDVIYPVDFTRNWKVGVKASF